jgi:hypothetical protein
MPEAAALDSSDGLKQANKALANEVVELQAIAAMPPHCEFYDRPVLQRVEGIHSLGRFP